MKISAKARRIVVIMLLVIVVFIFMGVIVFLGLQVSGKYKLYSKADSGQMLVTMSELAVSLGGSQIEEDEDWQYGDFRYNGIHYRYNTDILTFLFLGIDKMTEVQPVEDGLDGGQSDAIFLLVLNSHNKEAYIISIPRDTMTEIDVYDRKGEYLYSAKGQLTLQHGYGDGAALSCERTRDAVSKLFYGLPIHGYCAINMGAIPLINDAVGGIELQALETLDIKEFQVEEGAFIRLEGMDAYYYLHNRDTTSFNSAGKRLERQKQYLTAYATAAIQCIKDDITFPVTLYSTLSKYMVTDIGLDEVSYLATQALGYHFGDDNICSLSGATIMGERFEEFHVNNEKLLELILDVFYEEVVN